MVKLHAIKDHDTLSKNSFQWIQNEKVMSLGKVVGLITW